MAGVSRKCDDVAGFDSLPCMGDNLGAVSVQSDQPAAMADYKIIPIAVRIPGNLGNSSILRRMDLCAGRYAQIDACMDSGFSVDRVNAGPEFRGDQCPPVTSDRGNQAGSGGDLR